MEAVASRCAPRSASGTFATVTQRPSRRALQVDEAAAGRIRRARRSRDADALPLEVRALRRSVSCRHPPHVEPGVAQAEPRAKLRAGHGRAAARADAPARARRAARLRARATSRPRKRPSTKLPSFAPSVLREQRERAPAVVGRGVVVGILDALQPRLRIAAREDVLDVLGVAAGGREEEGHDDLAAVGDDLAGGRGDGGVGGRRLAEKPR